MSEEDVRGERFRAVLVPLLFLASGAAGLINEVSWARQVGLVLGMTARSTAVVLAAYFAGMAVGAVWASRRVAGTAALRGYGWAEVVVGLTSAMVPLALRALEAVDSMVPAGRVDSVGLSVLRSVGGGVAILPASIALGATWPFMAAWASGGSRARIARVYAWNTAGAALGVVVATSFLLVYLGVVASNLAAAGVSLGCGVAALVLAREGTAVGASVVEIAARPRVALIWYGLAGLSGFGLLALQVLSARLFALVFHNSAYTFGLVTAIFLGALAMGSAAAARFGSVGAARLVVRAAGVGSICLVMGVAGFVWLSGLRYFAFGGSFATYVLGAALLVAGVLGVPVAAFGAILPGCWLGVAEGCPPGVAAARVGRLTAINGVAGAAGALGAGFVLLPWLGLWGSIGLLAGGFAVVPVWALARRRRLVEAAGFTTIMLGLIRFMVGTAEATRTLPEGSTARIVAGWEGAHGRVEVIERRPGVRVLRQDLHYGLGSSGDSTPREYRQGHLPLLLHPRPRRVAFLGLGTGLTAAASLSHGEVEEVDVIELVPEVVEAAGFFAESNRNRLNDPRVSVRIDDARHDLKRDGPPYDVIVADLYVPWESRAGYLFTTEFYGAARRRLAPGGLFCQWLPLYQVGDGDARRILNSFARVFPATTLWWGRLSSETSILAMVGSEGPIRIDLEALGRRLGPLRGTFEPDERYLDRAEHLARLYAGDWLDVAGSPVNSDEHPWVEFHAPLDQRGGRLLVGERLLRFFDESLAPLSSGLVEFDVAMDRRAARAWQRRMIVRDEGRAGPVDGG